MQLRAFTKDDWLSFMGAPEENPEIAEEEIEQNGHKIWVVAILGNDVLYLQYQNITTDETVWVEVEEFPRAWGAQIVGAFNAATIKSLIDVHPQKGSC